MHRSGCALLKRSCEHGAGALVVTDGVLPNGPQGERTMTNKIMAALVVGLVSLSLTACGSTPGGRAVSGGLLGAGAGAGVGAATGGNVGTGALIGGGVGAAGGALTAPRRY